MKIVSFSVFGDKETYRQGAIENAKLLRQLLPDYQAWFYVSRSNLDLTIPLTHEGARVIPMRHGEHPRMAATMWRFLPAGDILVERVIFRDTDDRWNHHMTLGVRKWEELDTKGVSFYAAGPHFTRPTLAGLSGLKGGCKEISVKSILAKSQGFRWMYDEAYLVENGYLPHKDDWAYIYANDECFNRHSHHIKKWHPRPTELTFHKVEQLPKNPSFGIHTVGIDGKAPRAYPKEHPALKIVRNSYPEHYFDEQQ